VGRFFTKNIDESVDSVKSFSNPAVASALAESAFILEKDFSKWKSKSPFPMGRLKHIPQAQPRARLLRLSVLALHAPPSPQRLTTNSSTSIPL
jgi:hypothetical protein